MVGRTREIARDVTSAGSGSGFADCAVTVVHDAMSLLGGRGYGTGSAIDRMHLPSENVDAGTSAPSASYATPVVLPAGPASGGALREAPVIIRREASRCRFVGDERRAWV